MPIQTINIALGKKVSVAEVELPDYDVGGFETLADRALALLESEGKYTYDKVVSVGGLRATDVEIKAAEAKAKIEKAKGME